MRTTAIVIAIVSLSSVLMARPTVSVYIEDNEPRAGIKPRQTIDFCASGVYGWLGRLDLLATMRTHTPPLYRHLSSQLDPSIPWTPPFDASRGPHVPSFALERCTPARCEREPAPLPAFLCKPPDTGVDRNIPPLTVLDLVGERSRVETTLSTKAAMLSGRP